MSQQLTSFFWITLSGAMLGGCAGKPIEFGSSAGGSAGNGIQNSGNGGTTNTGGTNGSSKAGAAGCITRTETYNVTTQFAHVPAGNLTVYPECIPTCGVSQVGGGISALALPAGACTTEPACEAPAYPPNCPPCSSAPGPWDGYLCVCSNGRWSCTIAQPGAGVCVTTPGCPNPDGGSGGASAGGASSTNGGASTTGVGGASADGGFAATGGSTATSTSVPVTVSIQPGLTSYSIIMSSVPGLPLSPAISDSTMANLTFHWQADFGTFLLWPEASHVIQNLGSNATVDYVTVYWTYYSIPATQDPVHITLQLLSQSGEALSTSTITLTWNAQGGVSVS